MKAIDAQAAMSFLVNQQSHIETEVNETKYPEIQYPALVPVDTSAHDFAKTITYYSSDKHGEAKWINGNADDIPLAGTELQKHETSVHMAGIGYGYGYEELHQAMHMGYPLRNNDAMAARRAYEEHIDKIVFYGDQMKGMDGLINNPAVTAAPVITGNWATATEDQMLEDINNLIIGTATASNYTAIANTVLIDPVNWSMVATQRLGDMSMTLLRFLQANNAYTAQTGQPLMFRAVRGLGTAGNAGTARMVAYRRDLQTLKLNLPMPHRFLDVYQDGPLNWVVPGVFRTGGLEIRRPAEVRYGDGL